MNRAIKFLTYTTLCWIFSSCAEKSSGKWPNGRLASLPIDSMQECKNPTSKYLVINITHSFNEPGIAIEYKNSNNLDSLYLHILTVSSNNKYEWYASQKNELIEEYNQEEVASIYNKVSKYIQDSSSTVQTDGDQWMIKFCDESKKIAKIIDFGNTTTETVNANDLQNSVINLLRHTRIKDDTILKIINQHIRNHSPI